MTTARRWVEQAIPATPQERAAALWSFAYFFALLAGYYVLRPLRDQMGIAGGVRNLPWLFTATFVTLLVTQPLYGELVAKLPRARFIAIVYQFFVVNLALFWLLLTLDIGTVIVARVFFVWVSVFNLFAVAVFWSFMADLFTPEQGKRLFGFIGGGGTAGALLGPLITIWLSVPLGPVNLLIAAAIFLEVAVFCVYRLERVATTQAQGQTEQQRIGGGAFAGLTELIRSPYLLGVGAWVSLLSFGATILYFAQAHIVAAEVHDAGAQTRIFASIDFAVSLLTLATQVVATGPLLKRFGTGVASGALPAIYIVGFAALAATPTLAVVITLQVLQRWMNFAIANPARQVFFTVVEREEKYKAKNLIDVVVYRGSDALYGWVFDSLQALGLKLGAIALVGVPVAVAWLALSAALGRTQERRVAPVEAAAQGSSPDRVHDPMRDGSRFGRCVCRATAGARGGKRSAYPRDSAKRQAPSGGWTRHRQCVRQWRGGAATGGRNRTSAYRLIDTASTYGEAEALLGDVMATGGLRDRIFIATKLEEPDAVELKRSLSRLKTERLDLLQLHNVDDPNQSLAQFKEWKAQGVCRYIGITSTFRRDYPAVEAVLRREKPDFLFDRQSRGGETHSPDRG